MLSQSYSIEQFQAKIQHINIINQFIELAKQQTFHLEIDLIHRIPSVLTWRPADDTFSGDYNLLVYPRLTLDGKLFTPSKMVSMQLPSAMGNCETAFLEAMKQAISGMQQVWN